MAVNVSTSVTTRTGLDARTSGNVSWIVLRSEAGSEVAVHFGDPTLDGAAKDSDAIEQVDRFRRHLDGLRAILAGRIPPAPAPTMDEPV